MRLCVLHNLYFYNTMRKRSGMRSKKGHISRTKKKNYMVWDSLRPASAREICKKFENNGKKY